MGAVAVHDLTVARDAGVIAALNWAASQLDRPTLADSGYDGAGQGIKTPIKGRRRAEPRLAGSANSPRLRSCSPKSKMSNYAILGEIALIVPEFDDPALTVNYREIDD